VDQSFRFGTVGSPKSTPKKPGGSVGAIQQLRTLGFGAFELGWVQSVRVSEETCIVIAQSAQENDVLLSVHAPYFINLNATDEEWPKSRQRLMDAAYYGNMAGASDVIFHPGSYFGQPVEEVLERSIARLAGCVQELRSQGNLITVRPETMGKSAMLGSLADTLAMSQAIEGVEPCLDFAHLYARSGDGLCNTIEKWTEIISDYANILGHDSLKRLHIHLSGIEYGPKGERNHVPVLECELDLTSLFKTLKTYECAGRILCESPAMEEDALVLQTHWQKVIDET
jgi:deoxyribonuclease IV